MSKRPPRKKNKPDVESEVSARIEKARVNQEVSLDLSSLGLIELPESVGQLTQLEGLYLFNNELKELPESIGRLTRLQRLSLNDNQFTELPEFIGQLINLRSLSLTRNRLTLLPKSINQLIHLEDLALGGNSLSSLPENIASLINLRILYIWGNKLATLPELIGKFINLHTLYLSDNKLTTLPESIGQLTNLRELYLYNNQLTTLPESLKNLESLEELYLHDNPALGLPAEVLGRAADQVSDSNKAANPADILDYYFRVREDKRPLNEAKLILVGRGAVGKTSLVNRLVHGLFKDEKKTEGIKITEWPITLNGNEDVRLNVWDFGGQEIMHATHQFFLTQRSLYLLVLNGREGGEDADADYWLKLIESFGGDSPVIVVLNKIKEHPFDVNRRALQQKYSGIREFIKTDCKQGTGLKQLRKAIERETDRLEHLRDAFPASWFSIKDRLSGMRKNYLSFVEYRRVCSKHGEKDGPAQESLAFYLHSLGIALNYRDDPRLQDTHVLNPHWVTNGIYKILNSDKLEKQKGVIRLPDLQGILDSRKYPSEMHRFIFDLMKKFDLCFSFPDDDTRYLIPELLDKQEPSDTEEFKPEKSLNFQYHYTVLPEGLLPRFIVRTHVLSEGLPRWRTGTILKFENSRALVKADVQDKKVFISVSGPASSRRQLLGIIRSDFERIHREIRNLQPQEMVPVPGYPSLVVSYKKLLVMDQRRVEQFTEVVDDDVITLNVQALLNGVEVERAPGKDLALEIEREGIKVFLSYSHKDENLRNQLETHLKLMQREGRIAVWHDRKIQAGEEWERRIDDNLDHADIILLLVSPDFIASDYCYEKEMARALERHEKGEAQIIPVIVRDVNWENAPFAALQAVPKNGKAVTTWPNRDTAWKNVAEGIAKVIDSMRKKSRQRN